MHGFSKVVVRLIRLVADLGVEGDAHAGRTVQHRSRVARDPSQPNLRQLHLIPAELFAELAPLGFALAPGDIGENVVTEHLDLLALPTGTRLRLGREAVAVVTGLRNPCRQLDAFRPGLMAAVLARDESGRLVRKAGIMATILLGGDVGPGDPIGVELPSGPHARLEPV